MTQHFASVEVFPRLLSPFHEMGYRGRLILLFFVGFVYLSWGSLLWGGFNLSLEGFGLVFLWFLIFFLNVGGLVPYG